MKNKFQIHQKIIIIFLIVWTLVIFYFPNIIMVYYNKDVIISLAISFGASILSIVGIFTSILTSNENKIRLEKSNLIEEIIASIENKLRSLNLNNPFNNRYSFIYSESINHLRLLIDNLTPIHFFSSIYGIISFFFFIGSIYYILLDLPIKIIMLLFFYGVAFGIGYIFYILYQYMFIDELDAVPLPEKRVFFLDAVIINNNSYPPFDPTNNILIKFPRQINQMTFIIKYSGKMHNAFLHCIIKYKNKLETHIPDNKTQLLNYGFVNGYQLAIYSGIDTGILQGETELTLFFDIPFKPINDKDEDYIGKINLNNYGVLDVYKYLSIKETNVIEKIEIRMYEDPIHRPNIKRRTLGLIEIFSKTNDIERE